VNPTSENCLLSNDISPETTTTRQQLKKLLERPKCNRGPTTSDSNILACSILVVTRVEMQKAVFVRVREAATVLRLCNGVHEPPGAVLVDRKGTNVFPTWLRNTMLLISIDRIGLRLFTIDCSRYKHIVPPLQPTVQ
jgi:hypothetical protein